MRTVLTAIALIGFVLIAVACGGGQPQVVMDEPVPAGAEGAQVVELNFTPVEIQPDKVTIKSGAKVLYVIKNTDKQDDHNLVAADIGLKEILVKPGQTVRRLWTAPSKTGEFPAGCTIHPEIRMKFTFQ
ncbi:MAG: cupredoxin domain-containing protein [Chloroflexi bacterium]|nr:cupredoxin domain-containing protein [Chloroflexota bacterium]